MNKKFNPSEIKLRQRSSAVRTGAGMKNDYDNMSIDIYADIALIEHIMKDKGSKNNVTRDDFNDISWYDDMINHVKHIHGDKKILAINIIKQ